MSGPEHEQLGASIGWAGHSPSLWGMWGRIGEGPEKSLRQHLVLLVTATQRPRLKQETKKATEAEEHRESKQRQTSSARGGPVTTGWPGRTSSSDLSNGLGPECAGLAGSPFIRSYRSTPPTQPTLGFSTQHSACLGLGVALPAPHWSRPHVQRLATTSNPNASRMTRRLCLQSHY